MRQFYQMQSSQVQLQYSQMGAPAASVVGGVSSKYYIAGHPNPGFCYFVFGVFCSLEGMTNYRTLFFGQQYTDSQFGTQTSSLLNSTFRGPSTFQNGISGDRRIAEIAESITAEEVKNKTLLMQMNSQQQEKEELLKHT